MDALSPHPTLTIKIDHVLAAEYRDAYRRALGSNNEVELALDEFVAGFVEDRLSEEIAFLGEEFATDQR